MIGNIQLFIKTYKKSREEYITIKQQIIARLIEIGINCKEIFYTKDRNYFNSLNILVSFKSKNPIEIISKFSPSEIQCKYNNIYSFDYSCNNTILPIQINLINIQNFEMTNFYYSYSIINSIISYISISIGLEYGIDGLSVKIFKNNMDSYDKNINNYKKILLSDNPIEICDFFGFNYSQWLLGFETQKDIYKWLKECLFFKSNLFKLDNHISQFKSIKKRALLSEFINYIQNTIEEHTYDEIVPYMNLQKTAIGYFNKIDTYIELTHTEQM
jgi:hypothetical protein